MDLLQKFYVNYRLGVVANPFEYLSLSTRRIFAKEWNTGCSTLDLWSGLESRREFLQEIISLYPCHLMRWLDKEHYIYLYAGLWRLNVKMIRDASLVSIIKWIEFSVTSMCPQVPVLLPRSKLKVMMTITELPCFYQIFEQQPNERYFINNEIMGQRLKGISSPLSSEYFQALNLLNSALANPYYHLLMRVLGCTTRTELASIFKKGPTAKDPRLYEIWNSGSLTPDELAIKLKVRIPLRCDPYIYLYKNLYPNDDGDDFKEISIRGHTPCYCTRSGLYLTGRTKEPYFYFLPDDDLIYYGISISYTQQEFQLLLESDKTFSLISIVSLYHSCSDELAVVIAKYLRRCYNRQVETLRLDVDDTDKITSYCRSLVELAMYCRNWKGEGFDYPTGKQILFDEDYSEVAWALTQVEEAYNQLDQNDKKKISAVPLFSFRYESSINHRTTLSKITRLEETFTDAAIPLLLTAQAICQKLDQPILFDTFTLEDVF